MIGDHGAALFVNVRARRGGQLFQQSVDMLRQAGVKLGQISAVDDPMTLPREVEAAIAAGYDRILIGGGDGTLSSAIGSFANRPVTLGVLPLGTGNLFARTLGIERLSAAVAAIAGGRIVDVDLASANDRAFINTLSVGLSGAFIQGARPGLKRRIGNLAYVVATAAIVANSRPFHARITLGADAGEQFEATVYQIVVSNGEYVAIRLPAGPGASIDDRQLIFYILGGSRFRLIEQALRVALTRQMAATDMHYRMTQAVTITTDQPQTIVVDGEPVGVTPVRVQLLSEALRVFAPPEFMDRQSRCAEGESVG